MKKVKEHEKDLAENYTDTWLKQVCELKFQLGLHLPIIFVIN